MRKTESFLTGLVLSVGLCGLVSCHPRDTRTTRLSGSIIESRTLAVSESVTVTGLSVRLDNHGRSDERIRRYFLRTPSGEASDLLTNGDFRDRFSGRVQRWGRMGLPTVLSAGAVTKGWLFFLSAPPGSRLVFRLLNTYGTAESLSVPLPPPVAKTP
ncbi:hypothetical protein [Leptospirillum ferriphilum]|uniref:Lipoprotein n=2 Tax=Leptospirillum ferriphilum TaxID=178606 RepID=A0A1V3SSH5_9BACT|nr:hypothetical protein [Leptospirillum ferriphilum]AFS52531.1 hypothetical protein LFML04_0286 [Leptospirillum ferriphilum ML-04]OOH69734.1 hypothetical protein BOX24_11995 [Leptospirillum ferriphilum]